MVLRMRTALVAVASVFALVASFATSANASVLSLLPGSCGSQAESQVFAPWGDSLAVHARPGRQLRGRRAPLGPGGRRREGGRQRELQRRRSRIHVARPARREARPRARSRARASITRRCASSCATRAPRSSHLIVQAIYPGLLGGLETTTLGEITASSTWAPSPGHAAAGQQPAGHAVARTAPSSPSASSPPTAPGPGASTTSIRTRDPYARG